MQSIYTELFSELYERIGQLRHQRVRMKDIASHVELPSSVVSALYSSVLPTFLDNVEKMGEKKALEYATSQVNNVSQKRIIAQIPEICQKLRTFVPEYLPVSKDFFLDSLGLFALRGEAAANSAYMGTYLSYSLSSSCNSIKVEPIVLSQGDSGEVKAVRRSAYGLANNGTAIFAPAQNSLYLMFNEKNEGQLALVTMFIQLPFHENVTFLRGIYITLDYNRNPIARRILLVKSDDAEAVGRLVKREDLTGEQVDYYDYLAADVLKMCSVPFPKFNVDDLAQERAILSIVDGKRQ